MWVIQFLHIFSSIWGCHFFFYFSFFDKCAVIFQCGSNLHFPVTHVAQHLVMCLSTIYIFSSVKCLLVCPAHFQIGLFCFSLLSCDSSFHRLYSSLCQIRGLQISFSQTVAFHPLNRIFLGGKVLLLMKPSLSIFPFMDCVFGVKSENSLPSPRTWTFSPIFFPKSFIVFYFTSRVHFALIFI